MQYMLCYAAAYGLALYLLCSVLCDALCAVVTVLTGCAPLDNICDASAFASSPHEFWRRWNGLWSHSLHHLLHGLWVTAHPAEADRDKAVHIPPTTARFASRALYGLLAFLLSGLCHDLTCHVAFHQYRQYRFTAFFVFQWSLVMLQLFVTKHLPQWFAEPASSSLVARLARGVLQAGGIILNWAQLAAWGPIIFRVYVDSQLLEARLKPFFLEFEDL